MHHCDEFGDELFGKWAGRTNANPSATQQHTSMSKQLTIDCSILTIGGHCFNASFIDMLMFTFGIKENRSCFFVILKVLAL